MNARACVPDAPAPSDWQKLHRNKAGLFRAQTFSELARLHEATLYDASSEISIFCLKADRHADLLAFLTGPGRPDLSKFLLDGELFIDIVLGIDLGYWDSILIKSPQNIEKRCIHYRSNMNRLYLNTSSIHFNSKHWNRRLIVCTNSRKGNNPSNLARFAETIFS
jgi:hypothetical protein